VAAYKLDILGTVVSAWDLAVFNEANELEIETIGI
jgi:hypothetical protein